MSERTDREELELLRIAIARIAQAAGVETPKLPVIEKSYSELAKFAKEDRGWNGLAGAIVETINDHAMIYHGEVPAVIEALSMLADRMMMGDGSYSDYLYEFKKRLEKLKEERGWR